MQQNNVSNALHISGTGFSISFSYIEQAGLCLWPPESDTTNFPGSTTLYFHAALDGHFHHNRLLWHCSAFDMDVSSRIIFEDNEIICTQQGVIPHGNSASFYDWAHHPASKGYSYSHNTQSRPANNIPLDWGSHETFTTDGPGGWGAGLVAGFDGTTLVLQQALVPVLNPAGAVAVVINGSGLGQYRNVVSRVNLTSIVLDEPFDGHVVAGNSLVAVVASVGAKLVTGNVFTWTSVVQNFGTTFTGVFADNTFEDANNALTAYSGTVDGTVTGFGLCYGGMPQPLFFAEYTGNTMTRSNGISIHDDSPDGTCKATYDGPYVRWQVIRGNSIAGRLTECEQYIRAEILSHISSASHPFQVQTSATIMCLSI